jgi:hypothetical protein
MRSSRSGPVEFRASLDIAKPALSTERLQSNPQPSAKQDDLHSFKFPLLTSGKIKKYFPAYRCNIFITDRD